MADHQAAAGSSTRQADLHRRLEEMCSPWRAQFKVPQIGATEVHDLIEEHSKAPESSKLVVVDVRSPDEQKVSVLPGPTLTQDTFNQHKEQYKDHLVVTYCTAGLRSCKFAQQLQEEGYNVKNFLGSILAWTQEGYPLVELENRQQETRKVHTWSQQWGELRGDGYEAVVFQRPIAREVGRMLFGWLKLW